MAMRTPSNMAAGLWAIPWWCMGSLLLLCKFVGVQVYDLDLVQLIIACFRSRHTIPSACMHFQAGLWSACFLGPVLYLKSSGRAMAPMLWLRQQAHTQKTSTGLSLRPPPWTSSSTSSTRVHSVIACTKDVRQPESKFLSNPTWPNWPNWSVRTILSQQ